MAHESEYTARWYANKIKEISNDAEVKVLAQALSDEMTVAIDGKPKEQAPAKVASKGRLCILVGHSKADGGATFALGGNEFKFNSKVAELMVDYAKRKAPGLETKVVFRVSGRAQALTDAAAFKPNASIELHFNAANGQAKGTETLCTDEKVDQSLAKIVQKNVCKVFDRGGNSRGVKPLSRGDRGYTNVAGLPGSANCLIEPFFGDNKVEAEKALDKQQAYAECLVDSVLEYLAN